MLDPSDIPSVAPDEVLARYVLYSRHVREDLTLRPEAFIPHPYEELSVTRHREATENEVWSVGDDVAKETKRTLHGRGDVTANRFLAQQLRVIAKPVARNPNHADVSGWPKEKYIQKLMAQEIAKHAKYLVAG